jgi:hypothetical protein
MSKGVVIVLLAVLIAGLMVQSGEAFLRNGRNNVPLPREDGFARDYYNQYYQQEIPQDSRFKKR